MSETSPIDMIFEAALLRGRRDMSDHGFALRAMVSALAAVLLLGCASADSPALQEARAKVLELCQAEGGQKVYGQVGQGSGLAILQLKAFYQDLGIDSFDHPDLKAMLNPDGLSLKEEALRELASRPGLNIDRNGVFLLSNTVGYYDLHISPMRVSSENRSVVPVDGPVGMYRFRTAPLASLKCDRYKQVIAKTSEEEALYPDAKIRAAFMARGQCYYAEYMGDAQQSDYRFPEYVTYTYTVSDSEKNIFQQNWIVYNTSADSIIGSVRSFGIEGLRPACVRWGVVPQPHSDIYKATGITSEQTWD